MPPDHHDGPLPLPGAPELRLVPVLQRLRGHATARGWLPQGLDSEVDEMRARHIAQRDRLSKALADVAAAETGFAQEDRRHAEGLRDAQRTGKSAPEDERTPQVEREAVLRDAMAVVWAAAEVLAEVVTEAVALLREAEERLLADLRVKAAEGDDRIRAAQEEVRAAQEAHFALLKTGQWLKGEVDGGPFGAQNAPTVGPVPPGITRDAVAGALERRWHEGQVPVG